MAEATFTFTELPHNCQLVIMGFALAAFEDTLPRETIARKIVECVFTMHDQPELRVVK